MDWISELRSGSTHDSISTRFGSIPLAETPDEGETSVAHSRVTLRSETPLGSVSFRTYLEADFLQSADRAPWRWRQYWGEIRYRRWKLLGGQAWSLLRVNRAGDASDVDLMNTLVVEPAYHVGLAGVRRKQLRLTREMDHGLAAAVEWESGGRFQARVTHDREDRRAHLEATLFTATRGRVGAGFGEVLAVKPRVRLVGAQFWSRGGGPEMLGLLPGRIHAVSVLQGVEVALKGDDLTGYAYGGFVYGGRSAGNRFTRQYTVGAQKRLARGPLGALMWNTQFSQFDRATWDGRSGSLSYLMTGFRYLLPSAR